MRFPCLCEVDPNLPVATKHALTLVLLTEFHGRDPLLLTQTGQPFFTALLDWCSRTEPGSTWLPRRHGRLVRARPPAHDLFLDVVCLSAMTMLLHDAFAGGQPTDFESVARSLSIQPRVATPPRPTSHPVRRAAPIARHIYNRG